MSEYNDLILDLNIDTPDLKFKEKIIKERVLHEWIIDWIKELRKCGDYEVDCMANEIRDKFNINECELK